MGRLRTAWNALTKRDLASDEIGWQYRSGSLRGSQRVTADTALRHSAVWACLRLRANLLSSLPIDVFREVAGVQVEVSKPQVLATPEPDVDITEWLWATQMDLDRFGNCFGIITAKDAAGRPTQVELVAAGDVTVRTSGRRITQYRVGAEKFDPSLIWHERQYRPAGSPLGLSPIAYAAWSIGAYLSAQQFALDWYANGAAPIGVLRNTEKAVVKGAAAEAKATFKASVENRDIFVTGRDWEWSPAQGDANSAAFLEEMQYGATDVCRFFDVPADMVDAQPGGSSITYANITQRNVQLLVMNLGPAVTRRERAFSRRMVTGPRFVKLNRAALLAMDPETRARVLTGQVAARVLAPNEARALDDRPPFTDDQLAEFDRLFGAPRQAVEATQQRTPDWWPDTHVQVVGVRQAPLAIESGWAPLDGGRNA
ncbi:MAG TPA: phage portal protein [Micromonosporaceae bacterium]|nr:phage portal protein [Micromonosporaceae bacterium]